MTGLISRLAPPPYPQAIPQIYLMVPPPQAFDHGERNILKVNVAYQRRPRRTTRIETFGVVQEKQTILFKIYIACFINITQLPFQ